MSAFVKYNKRIPPARLLTLKQPYASATPGKKHCTTPSRAVNFQKTRSRQTAENDP